MKAKFLTDQGQIRSHNEDAGGIFYNKQGQLLAIVADGMGGHQAGDVASEMATSIIKEKWEQTTAFSSPDETEIWLHDIVEEINKKILEKAAEDKACQGMGTTIVLAICMKEFAVIANIGDSRCYVYNGEGFKQITEDHSLVNELVRSGQISKDDAEHHPRKNVLLKALGTEAVVTADIHTIGWDSEDKMLLCSDGLTNKIADEELTSYIASVQDLEATGIALINLANERGGEDNISLIIIVYDSGDKAGGSAC